MYMNRSFVFSLRLAATFLTMFSLQVMSAQTAKLGIQGIIKKSDGNAVEDGNYAFTFKLYNSATGGTALWTEMQPELEIANGIYTTILGMVTSLNLPFNTDYYLGVSVGTAAEITPRQQLTIAPYALSLLGTTNLFPSSGAIGAGTSTPSSSSQIHLKNASGVGKLLLEGTTGAVIDFKKASVTATLGLSSADNILRLNTGANNMVVQYNASEKLQVNTNGINVTGTSTFSNGLSVTSGDVSLSNFTIAGSVINNVNNTNFNFNNVTKLTLTTEGLSIPSHLSVTGTKNYTGAYSWMGSGGGNGCNSDVNSVNPYAINCSNRVRASEFDAFSDKRIKTDLALSDGATDLEILKNLCVTDYHHIDTIEKGAAYKKGFIAQEVEAVFPEAVTKTSDFIPNIYENARENLLSEGKLTIVLNKNHDVMEGDVVRLMLPNAPKEVTVSSVPSANTFTISDWTGEKPEWVFVYGKQVRDFRQVDYDRIHTLNISATQELIRRKELLEKQKTQLRIENNELKASLERLDNRIRSVEASVAN
jgi:Chaperone of endosialidase